jgi:hypothetical protein
MEMAIAPAAMRRNALRRSQIARGATAENMVPEIVTSL